MRYSWRALRRSPSFTLTAVLVLAFGIGANTAIFSLVDAILLEHLPVRDARQLVRLSDTVSNRSNVERIATHNSVFDGYFGRFPVTVNVRAGDQAEPESGELVTGQYFRALHVRPALGRLLNQSDIDNAPGNPVCVISHRLWENRFGSDPAITSRVVVLNGIRYHVLGVAERGFLGSELRRRIDFQLPVSRSKDFVPALASNPNLSFMGVMARLRPGITLAQAEASVFHAQDKHRPAEKVLRFSDGSQGFNPVRDSLATPVVVLMSIVFAVLLIACAGLANLFLARAIGRQREFAIRISLGAGLGHLFRQLSVESGLLSLLGGVGGVALSFLITRGLLAVFNEGRPIYNRWSVSPSITVLGFSFGLSLVVALCFGFAPWWLLRKLDVAKNTGGNLLVQASTRSGRAFRNSVIVAQLALSLAIIFAAGLLTRTLATLQTVDLGYQPGRVLVATLNPEANGYKPAQRDRFYEQVLGQTRQIPGIRAASLAAFTPNGDMGISMTIDVPGYLPPKQEDATPLFNFISPGYLETMNQPLLSGRDFNERDRHGATSVAIVNQAFVDRFMKNQNALGRNFRYEQDVQIVGVVRNARLTSARDEVTPFVYLPRQQVEWSQMTLLARTSSDESQTLTRMEQILRRIDPDLPVTNAGSLAEQVGRGLSNERILGILSGLFASLAIGLSAVALYGLVAYSMGQRTAEIGIRIALGAQRSSIYTLSLKQTMPLIAGGLFIGIPLALIGSHFLRSLLFGLTSTDWKTLIGSGAFLLAIAIAAAVLPLRSLSSIDPAQALKRD